MWKHVICFKFKDREQAPVVAEKLRSLVGRVESLRSLECGVDILGSERSYDLILITTFDDQAGYKAYDVHPAHQEVRKYIHGVRSSSVAIDYEF